MSTALDLPPERPLPHPRHVAARAQLEHYATSRRERLVQRWRRAAVLFGLGLGLAVAGGAAAGTVYLTKGPIPTVNGRLDLHHAPDFISAIADGKVVGYVPRSYLLPTPPHTPVDQRLTGVAPVYGPHLKKLVGHMYPGVGFVPLGKSITSVACQPEGSIENGTTSTIPCPSITETVPDVTGMTTPAGVVKVQAAGLQPVPENEHSRSVPNGSIVGTSPPAGARVPARTRVIVFNSLGP